MGMIFIIVPMIAGFVISIYIPMVIKKEREHAAQAVMDLHDTLKCIKGKPSFSDLRQLAGRIKGVDENRE